MLSGENSTINFEDLMQADSLMDYLSEGRAFTFGAHFDQIQSYPGLIEKFGEEIDKMFDSMKEYQENLSSIQDTMDPDDTFGDFIEKGINAYASKEDRIAVAFILGMYTADCAAKNE